MSGLTEGTGTCKRCGHGESEHPDHGTCQHEQGKCGCAEFVVDSGPAESRTLTEAQE